MAARSAGIGFQASKFTRVFTLVLRLSGPGLVRWAGEEGSGAKMMALLAWIRAKRLQLGEWLYWRRARRR